MVLINPHTPHKYVFFFILILPFIEHDKGEESKMKQNHKIVEHLQKNFFLISE